MQMQMNEYFQNEQPRQRPKTSYAKSAQLMRRRAKSSMPTRPEQEPSPLVYKGWIQIK